MRKKKLKTGHERLTCAKAFLLGVFYGDGHIASPYQAAITIPEGQEELQASILRSANHVWGCRPSIVLLPPTPLTQVPLYSLAFYSVEIVKDLRRYGPIGSKLWRVPSGVKQAGKGVKGSFLRGLFDTDGSLGSYSIELYSASRSAMIDVAKLLDSMEMRAKVYTSVKRKSYNGPQTLHTVRIQDVRSQRKFQRLVGFTLSEKSKKLKRICLHEPAFSWPEEAKKKLRGLVSKGYSIPEAGRMLGISRTSAYRIISRKKWLK